MKKFIIFMLIIVILLLCIAGAVYFFRDDIFQYSAESLIKKNLPDNMTVEEVNFNIEKGYLDILGFRLLNPPGYEKKYLCYIRRFICEYENKGLSITDGITVTGITAEFPELYVERRSDGKINLQEVIESMQATGHENNFKSLSDTIPEPVTVKGDYAEEAISKNEVVQNNFVKEKIYAGLAGFDIFDFLELTDTIKITGGNFIFKDFTPEPVYQLSLDDINGKVRFIFNDDYKKLISIETRGDAIVNGYRDQNLEWVSILEPNDIAPAMSNTFKVENIDITRFKPYYDQYLPIDIINARASGKFVINFDNGNIGSSNTVKLRDLKFIVKKDTSSSRYWEGAFNEILKYLTSAHGETIFDFKIKGSMENPAFYPGPYVKTAIQNMMVDKISQAVKSIQKDSSGQAQPGSNPAPASRPKTDAEKVVDIINMFLDEN